jgi:hypothetical protein
VTGRAGVEAGGGLRGGARETRGDDAERHWYVAAPVKCACRAMMLPL